MSVPHIDHIGIIVEDLDRSIAFFERLFNIKPTQIKDMTDVGLKIAQLQAENINIELLQYTDQGESFAKTVMGVKKGINHLSIQVKDIQATLSDLADGGVTVMEGFPRPGSHGTVAFLETDTTHDMLLEVCED